MLDIHDTYDHDLDAYKSVRIGRFEKIENQESVQNHKTNCIRLFTKEIKSDSFHLMFDLTFKPEYFSDITDLFKSVHALNVVNPPIVRNLYSF